MKSVTALILVAATTLATPNVAFAGRSAPTFEGHEEKLAAVVAAQDVAEELGLHEENSPQAYLAVIELLRGAFEALPRKDRSGAAAYNVVEWTGDLLLAEEARAEYAAARGSRAQQWKTVLDAGHKLHADYQEACRKARVAPTHEKAVTWSTQTLAEEARGLSLRAKLAEAPPPAPKVRHTPPPSDQAPPPSRNWTSSELTGVIVGGAALVGGVVMAVLGTRPDNGSKPLALAGGILAGTGFFGGLIAIGTRAERRKRERRHTFHGSGMVLRF